ncbi:hypothetical protein DL89DRAFT_90666 [Linderina pennispora]|uniref:Uncharacterized protein n=1 Tax=Linderina pennispora TaxID=61395 RepID=A0A1Y1WIT1_9FUNG|nr:uncharacterized protein DL89DRAFT_90666 [Linderina pennispora]ORX73275.1 hypothetical protein DL89DRAFT_90666 [Linderina pennispora]
MASMAGRRRGISGNWPRAHPNRRRGHGARKSDNSCSFCGNARTIVGRPVGVSPRKAKRESSASVESTRREGPRTPARWALTSSCVQNVKGCGVAVGVVGALALEVRVQEGTLVGIAQLGHIGKEVVHLERIKKKKV